jgi:hypothetical protein
VFCAGLTRIVDLAATKAHDNVEEQQEQYGRRERRPNESRDACLPRPRQREPEH